MIENRKLYRQATPNSVWGGSPKADMYAEEQGEAKKEERGSGENKRQIQ